MHWPVGVDLSGLVVFSSGGYGIGGKRYWGI